MIDEFREAVKNAGGETPATKANDPINCKYCGSKSIVNASITPDEFLAECLGEECPAGLRVYSRFRRYAIQAWNDANTEVISERH